MEIIQFLCDPITKEKLDHRGNLLYSKNRAYPIVNSIPIMLTEEKNQIQESEKLNTGLTRTGFSWALKHWYDLKINTLLGEAEGNKNLLLNFGSGSPREKENMRKQGYHVVSMDINAKYKGVDIIADGHYLPFKGETFNVITAFEVLEHLHEPWVAIKEINRVINHDGRFVGSVAFLKEYHASYFHMSFLGVIKLLEYGGFEVTDVYGGQSVFSRLIHNILPLGPKAISEGIYNLLDKGVMSTRSFLWSIKHKKKSTSKLDGYVPNIPISFKEYDRIKFAPTVLFSAKKVKSWEELR